MSDLGAERQHQSLRLKMGIHEGSCLAVTLNGQQDYFGQTVNIASRVQGLAASRSIVVTEQVVENAHARALLESSGLQPVPRRVALTGIAERCRSTRFPERAAAESAYSVAQMRRSRNPSAADYAPLIRPTSCEL